MVARVGLLGYDSSDTLPEDLHIMKIKLVAFNGRYVHSCLALFYVRNQLLDNLDDCRPELLQFTINDPYYPTLLRITADEPDGIFISVYIWNSHLVRKLVVDLGRLLPDTPVVLGGPQAPFVFGPGDPGPSNCTVVRGEVEGLGRPFYDDLLDGRLRAEYEASPSGTFPQPYMEDDYCGQLKNRHLYYESARGCPFGCTYCLSAAGPGVRHKGIGQVCDELRDILAHRPRIIRFVDRTFNDLPERAMAIWRFLQEQAAGVPCHFEIAPDRFTSEMFDFLGTVEPGCFQFEIGLQSTNPQTLAAVNRRCDLEKARSNIARLAAMGTIHIHLDLILGLPFETLSTFRKSFGAAFDLGPHYIQMGLLKILPETPISQETEKFGMVECGSPPYEVLATKWLDQETLAELYWFGECVEAFHNNRFFRSLWLYLRGLREDGFAFFTLLLAVCRRHAFFERTATQELMSTILSEATQERPDAGLISELLLFDWLRSGHRFLPAHFDEKLLQETRKRLWVRLPQNWEGVYDYRNRDEFFKQGVFVPFSAAVLRQVGHVGAKEGDVLCFCSSRETGVFEYNRTLLIPAVMAS